MQSDLFENENVVRWRFTPLTPLREDVLGEVVFTKKWQDMMGGSAVGIDRYFLDNEPENYPILGIYQKRFFNQPRDRDTRLATSIINWLGTNNGRNFLNNAEQLKDKLGKRYVVSNIDKGMDYSDAYILAWEKENQRNGQPRFDHTPRSFLSQSLSNIFGDAANLHDIEVMGCIIDWLGKPDGQKFIQDCQQEIDLRLKEQRSDLFKARDIALDI